MPRPDATPRSFPQPTIWMAPAAILFALWLFMAFSSGGFLPSQWLLPGLGVTFLALVVGATRAYPHLPGELSLAVLALFTLHTAWTVLSALWAPSLNSVWDEAGRTAVYLLALAVALVYFTDRGARDAARYILLAGALVIVGVVTWRFASLDVTGASAGTAAGPGLASLFIEDRLAYPTSYPNGAAALYLVLFWPLLWLAADPRESVPVRALSLATTWGLLALTILTQSRGALWAGVITLVVLFVLSPARLRTLLFLAVPAGLALWGFPALNSYWRLGPESVGGGEAVRTILIGMAAAAAVGAALAASERWVKIPRRVNIAIGALVLLAVIGLLAYGLVLFDREVGEPTRWLGDWWRSFTAERTTVLSTSGDEASDGEDSAGSRFLTISTNGRWDIWRVAWQDFRDSPWLGVGAGNYVYTYERLRRVESSSKPRQPHSLGLRLLSETGIIGAALLLGSLLLGLGGILWPRFSAGWHRLRRGPPPGRWGADPKEYSWEFALAIGVTYWFVHANVDWLWHMPGVSLAPLLLLALGVASVDARAGILWPRLWKIRPSATVPGAAVEGAEATGGPATGDADPEATDERAAGGGRAPAARPRRWEGAWFSAALTATAVAALVGLALPYVSLRFQDIALSRIDSDGQGALGAARLAARLQPVDPSPLLVAGEIYRLSAADTSGETALDELALSLDAYTRAIDRNPSDWALHYRAGMGALRLLETSVKPPSTSGQVAVQEAGDGTSAASLVTPQTVDRARELRALSGVELWELARGYLLGAQERSPLSGEVRDGLERLSTISPTMDPGADP